MSQRGMMKDGSLSKSPEFREREAQYVNTQSKVRPLQLAPINSRLPPQSPPTKATQ
jgi:hypothetical protein